MRNILFLTLTLTLTTLISCEEADTFDVRQDALVDYVTDINVIVVNTHFPSSCPHTLPSSLYPLPAPRPAHTPAPKNKML